jgi:predicted RNA-binding protein with PUA-like domain
MMPTPEEAAGWRDKLREWRRTHQPTISEDLRRLREEFVGLFPKEKLGEMSLEEYAIGTGDRENFSYWLEYKTRGLGGIGGGSAAKTGVWWSKSRNSWQWNEKLYRSAEDAFSRIREGLVELVRATEEGRFDELDEIGEAHMGPVRYLRSKPLSLYFPEQFLPMWHPDHIANFLQIFGATPQGEVLARNRQLLQLLRGLTEFEEFDTVGMMSFLYDSYPQKKPAETGDGAPKPPPEPPASVPRELSELMDATARTRNVLLYGPPGTGKTWLVNHFTNYFLLHHNVSAEAAGEYWETKATARGAALRERVRGGGGGQPSYWWMVANEERSKWSWNILFERGEWFFGKRTLARNFEAARPGDLIFGYQARPHTQLVALARVERGLETRAEGGEEKEGITIKPVSTFPRPLDWREVADNPQLAGSEPVRLNTRGSMFRLTAEEAQELARMLNDAGNNVSLPEAGARRDFAEFVTFHQSFAYEEFVEGLKPAAAAGGGLSYDIERGVFRRISASAEAEWRARGKEARKYLLVIDEINRANIAKVLGELITLVEDDKRLGEENEVTVRLPYSGERFGVPPNLFILGTMNTADRSIALLDLALRRRFTFVEMMPDPAAIEPAEVEGVDLRALLRHLNGRIARLLDRDHQIGHSYLRRVEDAEHLRFVWYKRIVPLLQEYFYNDGARLRGVIGPKFVPSSAGGSGFGEQSERERGEVARLEGEEFLEALRGLAAGGAGGQG